MGIRSQFALKREQKQKRFHRELCLHISTQRACVYGQSSFGNVHRGRNASRRSRRACRLGTVSFKFGRFGGKPCPYTHFRTTEMCIWSRFLFKRSQKQKRFHRESWDVSFGCRFFKFDRLGANHDHIHISAQRKCVYGDGLL